MNNEKESFLKRKNVIISFKRYGIDAMGSMALGLFASLLIGTIINTIGQNVCPGSFVSEKLLEIGGYATSVTGAAMALAIGMHFRHHHWLCIRCVRSELPVMQLVVPVVRWRCFLSQ